MGFDKGQQTEGRVSLRRKHPNLPWCAGASSTTDIPSRNDIYAGSQRALSLSLPSLPLPLALSVQASLLGHSRRLSDPMQQSRTTPSQHQGYLPLPAYTDSTPSLVSESPDDSFDSNSSETGAAVPPSAPNVRNLKQKRHSGRAWFLATSVSTVLAMMLLVRLRWLGHCCKPMMRTADQLLPTDAVCRRSRRHPASTRIHSARLLNSTMSGPICSARM